MNEPPTQYDQGDLIGKKYRLIRLLGQGGMSWVWLAENVDLEVEVAIKLIRTDLKEDTVADRLLGEARAIAKLGHRAIVRVFDFGTTDQGDPFIVMEVLKGVTLSQHLGRQGRIPPVELARTLLPVIDALTAAHAHGIVHRDLKPDNILLEESQEGIQPKLLDFGIAKLKATGDAIKDPKLTQLGTVVGSPFYMSPEQARGDQDLDARSDVFALSVLMYECLTHTMPFTGDGYNSVMWAIIEKDPKPLREHGILDDALWEILKKGLAKSRDVRFQSARELGEALARWLDRKGITEDICSRSLRASWLPNDRPTPTQPIPIPIVNSALQSMSDSPISITPEATALRGAFGSASQPKKLAILAAIAIFPFVGAFWILSSEADSEEEEIGRLTPSPAAGSQPAADKESYAQRKTRDEVILTPSALPHANPVSTAGAAVGDLSEQAQGEVSEPGATAVKGRPTAAPNRSRPGAPANARKAPPAPAKGANPKAEPDYDFGF